MARPDEELRAAQRRAEGLKATLEDIDDTLESLGNKIYRSTTIDPDKSVESFKKSLKSLKNLAIKIFRTKKPVKSMPYVKWGNFQEVGESLSSTVPNLKFF